METAIMNKEYKAMQAKALEKLRSGQSLTGKDGAFTPLLKQFIETALAAETAGHLDEVERKKGNKLNGKGSETLKTLAGDITTATPQDRESTFRPEIVKKRETVLADNLAAKIIGLYGLGMSFQDTASHIEEMYDVEIYHSTLSEIIDRIIPKVKEWQSRPLEPLYNIVWLDAMHYKVNDGGRVVSRTVYNVLSVNKDGQKELIGMFISESEGANFWLGVLTDLKSKGLKDILIASIDNLTGFAEAITTIFPKVKIQSCVVHQIRNSLKYVASKDQKAFIRLQIRCRLKDELLKLDEIWGKKYPLVLKSWHANWEKLTVHFYYDEQIRRLIYTTNAVEGFHRQVRKVTKTKGAFPNDMALLKLIYLATENISKKWTQSLQNWEITAQRLYIQLGDRMLINL